MGNNNRLRMLFMGTADFAVPQLEGLLGDSFEHELVGVVTQPNKPVGRKQVLRATPVKQFLSNRYEVSAKGNVQEEFKINQAPKSEGLSVEFIRVKNEIIPIFTPEKLKNEAEAILKITSPDLIVVSAYGQFVPDLMLSEPEFGAINIHGSLLPELRGAVPVHMAILQGLEKTGVTIQQMVKEMDAGPILSSAETTISDAEDTPSLMKKLAKIGADLLLELLPKIANKQVKAVPQDHNQATFCYQKDIRKAQSQIDFQTSAILAERMVRAFLPWPVAWLKLPNGAHAGKRLKIFAAELANVAKSKRGTRQMLIEQEQGGLYLRLSDGDLRLTDVQLAGKDRRPVEDYLWLVD